ncbi:DUF6484 domain-containing protein [Vibrio ostreicida]|uniref:DUF6484 domain-containing protein n=1 Tax=Vibrio ostreicida TaxID=526588 RepID=A0ABT8BXA2_9VIBR|nr:DUF6484 domain-containing protein [Vibrio ostreicida]MDN3611786.1 DUF6484 domain-containing protein [Vibrio ostreicida]NPD09601.1 hypothetical protein [Vibrio ostreicida]
MKQEQYLVEFEHQQQAEQSACLSRFGTIVGFDGKLDSVRVDFEGNPFDQPLSARLGRLFKASEIQFALDNQLQCRINFVGGDISLPIVTDVFYSMLQEEQDIVFRAKSMRFETSQEVTLASGDTQISLNGRDGRVTTKAKYVTSQADKAQKIQGATVAIN